MSCTKNGICYVRCSGWGGGIECLNNLNGFLQDRMPRLGLDIENESMLRAASRGLVERSTHHLSLQLTRNPEIAQLHLPVAEAQNTATPLAASKGSFMKLHKSIHHQGA